MNVFVSTLSKVSAKNKKKLIFVWNFFKLAHLSKRLRSSRKSTVRGRDTQSAINCPDIVQESSENAANAHIAWPDGGGSEDKVAMLLA